MNISFWNKSAERIFGYKKKEVLGKEANLIVPKSLKKELDKNLILMKKNKFIHDFKTKRVAKNGKLIDVSISASPLIDPKQLKKQGINAGDKVKIETRRGKVEVKVRFDRNVPNNVIFFPFAFKEAPANVLTNPKLDPFGKIPEFK